jgi:hypothetical protein
MLGKTRGQLCKERCLGLSIHDRTLRQAKSEQRQFKTTARHGNTFHQPFADFFNGANRRPRPAV